MFNRIPSKTGVALAKSTHSPLKLASRKKLRLTSARIPAAPPNEKDQRS